MMNLTARFDVTSSGCSVPHVSIFSISVSDICEYIWRAICVCWCATPIISFGMQVVRVRKSVLMLKLRCKLLKHWRDTHDRAFVRYNASGESQGTRSVWASCGSLKQGLEVSLLKLYVGAHIWSLHDSASLHPRVWFGCLNHAAFATVAWWICCSRTFLPELRGGWWLLSQLLVAPYATFFEEVPR